MSNKKNKDIYEFEEDKEKSKGNKEIASIKINLPRLACIFMRGRESCVLHAINA